jgi:hypothetical protein
MFVVCFCVRTLEGAQQLQIVDLVYVQFINLPSGLMHEEKRYLYTLFRITELQQAGAVLGSSLASDNSSSSSSSS